MGKINIMLMTFIMIGFIGFKYLFLQGATITNSEECDFVSPVTFPNCFITVNIDCPSGNVYDSDTKTVCINMNGFDNNEECNVNGVDFLQDIADCIKFVGQVILDIMKIVWGVGLAILALVGNLIILSAIYFLIGFSPIAGAPFIINFLLITPFIIGNLLVVVSLIPGE
jgi:hypothetical protein